MTYRRFVPVWVSFLLLTFLIAPIVAGTPSESAFKKLQSLAGKWEGKDAHGRAAKTSFDVLASGTAVMEKLEASGMEEMSHCTASIAMASRWCITAPLTRQGL